MESYLMTLRDIIVPFLLMGWLVLLGNTMLKLVKATEEVVEPESKEEWEKERKVKKLRFRAITMAVIFALATILWYNTFIPRRADVEPQVAEKMLDAKDVKIDEKALTADAEKKRDPTGIISEVANDKALKKMEEDNQYRKLLNRKGE